MNDTPATSNSRALVPTRQQLAFSRVYTEDRAQRQAGTLILAILLVGVLAWGLTAPIADPVVFATVVTLEEERQAFTHPHGGIVSERLPGHGDMVERGQVVLRLDSAGIEAQREQVRRERRDTLALQSRLLSTQQQGELSAADAETHQRRSALLAEKTAGLERQLGAQARLKALYETERKALAGLPTADGEQQHRLRDAERRVTEQEALLAELDARLATARLEQLAAESEERQRQQAERQLARAALEGAQQKLQLLERRQQALDEAMQATVVRAPAAGRVDFPPTLEAGRAIAPGEVVFSIRPGNADLVASAGMPPLAARRVVAGQQASIRLPGATAGDRVRLRGQVSDVSLSADGTSSWITVRIPAQMQRPSLHNPDTVPGRYPAEIVVDNENRALIQRLLDAL